MQGLEAWGSGFRRGKRGGGEGQAAGGRLDSEERGPEILIVVHQLWFISCGSSVVVHQLWFIKCFGINAGFGGLGIRV
jgi:hypothetical protein